MAILVDKSILFLLSCGILLSAMDGYFVLISILDIISISCFLSFFQSKKIAKLLIGIYVIACCMKPEFCCFLPLLFYDIFFYHLYILGVIGCISAIQLFNTTKPEIFLGVATVIVLSWCLNNKSKRISFLEQEAKKIRDTSEELHIVLKNKNKDLLEKQEYEIHMATLKERNRIAREIHDNVGHLLSRSILQLGAIMAINKEKVIAENLDYLKNTLTGAMDSIRESVHDLHDESIDLKGTIKKTLEEFPQYKVELDYDIERDSDKAIKYCFITTIKEALSNMAKHSNATKMRILLREHPGFFQLLIEDNGTKIKKNLEEGMGLENMKERVSHLDGRLDITTEKGFRIFISIPKEI